jgi:hypothetical protein
MKKPSRKAKSDDPWDRIEWDDSFGRDLESANDSELCDRVSLLVTYERGSDGAFDETQPDLCVFLVWGAKGVLDNGGFQYLFEGDYAPMDPDLKNTRRAFEIIGLPHVVAAFDIAFSAFEGDVPPANPERREDLWKKTDESLRERANAHWFKNNGVEAKVAAFIRRNAGPLLGRYGLIRKWPKAESLGGFFGVFQKLAWEREWLKAKEKYGDEFGTTHPEYKSWETWFLKNRKQLVEKFKEEWASESSDD